MSNGAKKVLTGSVVYTGTSMLTKMGSFFLLPLYTAFLSTTDYGTTNLIASFQGVMGYVVTLCMMHAVMRFYADVAGDKEGTARLFGAITGFVFVSGLAWVAILFFCRPLLEELVFSGVDFFPVVAVGVASLPGISLYQIYTNALRAMEKPKKFSIVSLVYFVSMVALNILFVVVLGMGALGIVTTTLILNTLFAVGLAFDFHRQGLLEPNLDRVILRQLVSYSAPLLPHNLSLQISVLVSGVLIKDHVSLGSLGLYSLANQFGAVADTMQTSVNTAYQPWFYRSLIGREDGYQERIRNLTSLLLWVYGFCFLCLAFFSKEAIFLLTNEHYHAAWIYVPAIVAVFALKSPYYFFIDVLYFLKNKTRLIFIASVTSSVVNVAVTFIAVPAIGVLGSVAADLCGTVVLTCIVVFLSVRSDRVGYEWWPFARYLLITLGMMAAIVVPDYLLNGDAISWFAFGIKVGCLGVYAILAAFVERKRIFAFVTARRSAREDI